MRKELLTTLQVLLVGSALTLVPSTATADWVGEVEVSIPFAFMVEAGRRPAPR